MAATAAAGAPPHQQNFFALPPLGPLPAEAAASAALWEDVDAASLLQRLGSSGEASASSGGRGQGMPAFSFGKALSGIKGEAGAAHNTRGDGKSADGGSILQR
jgi:hypothetical protein